MLATYSIQCAMVTAFFAIHAASRFGWKPPRRTRSGRLLEAVQESFRPFLDATLLFSIVLCLAAISTLSRSYVEEPETITMIMSSVYIALYGVFPAIVLHSCAVPLLRRRKERRYMWIFIAILVIIMGVMYFCSPQSAPLTTYHVLKEKLQNNWKGGYNANDTEFNEQKKVFYQDDDDNQIKWEALCLDISLVWRGYWTIVAIAGFLVVSAVLSLTFITNIFRIRLLRSERSPFLKKMRQHWWMISAVITLLIMWISIALFYVLRSQFNEKTGSTNQDKKWTFGQVLAVGTWAPVLMELLLIFRVGPEKALSGLMSDRFEVYEVADLGGERVIKSTMHLPSETQNGEEEAKVTVASPILSQHGSLSDSTALESPGVVDDVHEPYVDAHGEAPTNQRDA